MTGETQIDLAALNGLGRAEFLTALSEIYEHSPWAAEAALAARPGASLKALHDVMASAVQRADAATQLRLVLAHPDLAGKAARAGTLTVASASEQLDAGLDQMTEAEFTRFEQLNQAYTAKFGFPFIICVRRHSRDSILQQFEQRLQQDAAIELATALAEVERIAALRLDQCLKNDGSLKVHGRLSTHVLDNHAGRPAAGVAIELRALADDGAHRLVQRAVTNADGRTDKPLISGRPLPVGRYEISFDIGGYFAGRAVPLAAPPFLGIVPIRFAVAEPEGHYHVPLLATPWSYSTYRGS